MKKIVVLMVLAALLLSLAGCGAKTANKAEMPAYDQTAKSEMAPMAPVPADAAVTGERSAAGSAVERKVTRNASLLITVHDVREVEKNIQQSLAEAGGYVQESVIWQDNGRMRSTMTLRVPDDKIDEFIVRLETVGKVEEKNISNNDVTEEYYDSEARKGNLEKQEKRFLELLDKAESVKDMLEIENELARVRGEIESIQARLKVLDNLVDYATVRVQLKDPRVISAVETLKEPLGGRIQAAWQVGAAGLVNLAEGLLIFVVMLLPFVPVILVVGYAAKRIWKKRNATRKD